MTSNKKDDYVTVTQLTCYVRNVGRKNSWSCREELVGEKLFGWCKNSIMLFVNSWSGLSTVLSIKWPLQSSRLISIAYVTDVFLCRSLFPCRLHIRKVQTTYSMDFCANDRQRFKKTIVAFLAEVCKTFDLAYIWSKSRQTGIWIAVLKIVERNQEHTAWFRSLSIDEHREKQRSKKGEHFAFDVVEDCSESAVLSPVCTVLSSAGITQ